jgi:hypothetical protein
LVKIIALYVAMNYPERIPDFCYKPIALVTPIISSIVKETFTPSPRGFMISVTH